MDVNRLEALLQDERYVGKTITLLDGRQLSYSESGTLEGGYPVLFHIGLMASSFGVVLFHEEGIRLNLRIIAVDYPGVGDSSPQADRQLIDWPRDLHEFCNQILGEETEFALLCHSMGGPHALAVMTDTTLSSRISRATLVSPWLPFDDNNSWFLTAARNLPSFLQDSVIPSIATALTTSTLSMAGSVAACGDKAQLAVTQRIVGYSQKQGQEGNRQMVRIAIGASLIIPSSVSYPVHVFCGAKDELVTEESCQKLIALMGGGAVYTGVKNADHNSVMGGKSLSEIFLTLRGRG